MSEIRILGIDTTTGKKKLGQVGDTTIPAGGGGATWGSITGTLSSQTDLQTALDGKSATTHNHALNNLSEKSYNSLTDKPSSFPPSAHNLGGAEHNVDTLANLNLKISDNDVVGTDDSRLSDARTPLAHNQDASTINVGTLDGDRLPAMSATKKGGVPATGTPSNKYLRDDGTFQPVTASLPEVVPIKMTPTADQTILNDYAVIIARRYIISGTFKLTIQGTGVLRIQ